MNTYLNKFYSLNCSKDILEIIGKINREEKEITEVMSVVKQLRKIENIEDYYIVDLCAGNGLLGVTCAFLFKCKGVVSIDIRSPKFDCSKVKNYRYFQKDVEDYFNGLIYQHSIFVSIHPCRILAEMITTKINQYKKCNIFMKLVMMPCCHYNVKDKIPSLLRKKFGAYEQWCIYLYNILGDGFKKDLVKDNNCISPCNIILKAI
jgi:hypothetical protein